MKLLTILLFQFLFSIGYSQNFNGDFTSYKTSFQDFSSTKNNFIEETEFKIAVIINENNNDGRIVIQDPRIPKKLLVYKVITYLGEVEDDGIISFLFNGITDHLQNPIEVNLVFYYPKDKKLSLMVYSKETSQVFFDLIKK
jgi:hypothetical protein